MPTVFIANMAVLLPSRFSAGDVLTDIGAEVLNDLHLRRLRAKLRYLLEKGQVYASGLQAKAVELHSAELVAHATLDDEDEVTDPILLEALAIARDLITQRMADEGLPPPKGLDIHAKQLVDALPALQETARQRIEARFRAAQELANG